ncbi:hypothetical protein E2320_011278, partial [Naja naja]
KERNGVQERFVLEPEAAKVTLFSTDKSCNSQTTINMEESQFLCWGACKDKIPYIVIYSKQGGGERGGGGRRRRGGGGGTRFIQVALNHSSSVVNIFGNSKSSFEFTSLKSNLET